MTKSATSAPPAPRSRACNMWMYGWFLNRTTWPTNLALRIRYVHLEVEIAKVQQRLSQKDTPSWATGRIQWWKLMWYATPDDCWHWQQRVLTAVPNHIYTDTLTWVAINVGFVRLSATLITFVI